jgi:hypothetical protein
MPRVTRTTLSVVCMAMSIVAGSAVACKYSVRDVAFVDILPSPYHAYIHVDATTSQTTRDAITAASSAVFLDANVDGTVVDLATDPDHHSARGVTGPLPRIVLESPDGRTMSVPVGEGGAPSKNDVWEAIEAVATSRVRRRIRRRMFDAHTVILIAEGASAASNGQAARIAEDATSRVRETMDELPKPIAKPPYTIVIPASRGDEEAVLLWSLGVERTHADDAYVVVLFGRMRLLATPLRTPGATEADLFKYLDLVGQDCECTLDRSWMQGMMAPHYWDTHDETMALDSLGFDPGNPLVIAEVSRIVNKPTAFTDGLAPSGSGDGALGYSELVIGDTPKASDPTAAAAPEAARTAGAPAPAQSAAAPSGPFAGVPLGATAAVLVVVALAGGGFVLARSRRGL